MTKRLILVVIGLIAAGCGEKMAPSQVPILPTAQDAPNRLERDEAAQPTVNTPPNTIEKLIATHLPNPVRVTAKVFSGGLPEGDLAFAELQKLGVKTVISVDGAKPDLVSARKYGMQYVHLPHSYDGVPEERSKELAKAVRDLPGTIYIHCHHGKHRSPAAAAVACIGAGFINHDQGRQVLAIAGTGPNYLGLFQSVDHAKRLDMSILDELRVSFPETAKLPVMAEAMVAIEHTHDHLKMIEKAGWTTPADHPALTPNHEALLLREHFTELLRADDVKGRSSEFQELTHDAENASRTLEETLKTQPIDSEAASKEFAAITANCKSCHQLFRDPPGATKSLSDVHP